MSAPIDTRYAPRWLVDHIGGPLDGERIACVLAPAYVWHGDMTGARYRLVWRNDDRALYLHDGWGGAAT